MQLQKQSYLELAKLDLNGTYNAHINYKPTHTHTLSIWDSSTICAESQEGQWLSNGEILKMLR